MPSDDDVIVSRTFSRADGDVLLFIHRPEPFPKPEIDANPAEPPWRCFFTIRFPDGEIKRRYSVGIDGMQAMLLAIGAAEHSLVFLQNGTPERRPDISFLGEPDLGLKILSILNLN